MRRMIGPMLQLLARVLAVLVILATSTHLASAAAAPADPAWQAAQAVRQALFDAQTKLLAGDQTGAQAALEKARAAYDAGLATALSAGAPEAAQLAADGLAQAAQAIAASDTEALTHARASVWAALLFGAADLAIEAAADGRAAEAREWLLLREYQPTTRISRPTSDATIALSGLAEGLVTPETAVATLRADLLDTYQALALIELDDVLQASSQGLPLRQAEAAALARGYWRIIADSFAEQRGPQARAEVDGLFAAVETTGTDPSALSAAVDAARQALRGFRATPLDPDEAAQRANQLLRFLALVPFEYRQGVHDGQVILDIEIQEATTFLAGARAAFEFLVATLTERDAERTLAVDNVLRELDAHLQAAGTRSAVADASDIEALTKQATTNLKAIYPAEWQASDGGRSDFVVIGGLLDQLEQAVAAGQYGKAEGLRLEAYAVFDLGPELRLLGLAPDLAARAEGFFWHGSGGHAGLASLLAKHASPEEIHTARIRLDAVMLEADARLGAGPPAKGAVIFNAAVIVFREGLEAVLIFASLLASLIGARQGFRRPMVTGALLAGGATIATWLLFYAVLSSLRQYGQRLEAIVSLVAIAVLLLILNWFFHNTYWSRWIQRFHGRKRSLFGVATGQTLGFILIGFTSIYREGFETTLFLQALVLDSGTLTVLQGVALGLVATAAVGVLVFALQTKLPYKRMLIVTGLLITGVLVTMVGNTIHLFQAVGWLPITIVDGANFPYWTGVWLGLHPTWEGIVAQVGAAVFVVGSYVLAEYLHGREVRQREQGSGNREQQMAA